MALLKHVDGALLVVQCDEHTNSSDTTICDCKPEGAQLNGCKFCNFDISKNTLAEVRVNTVDFEDVRLDNCDFSEVTIRQCNFKDVQFVNCKFHNVEFYKFNLTKVCFENLDLRNVKFLHSVVFNKSSYDGRMSKSLVLMNCKWRNMRITNVVLSRMEFQSQYHGDFHTFERPRCTSKTTLEVTGEQRSFQSGYPHYVHIGTEYKTRLESGLRHCKHGKRPIYDRLVRLLFPKTLVLFRELPRDQVHLFGREDRFTHLSQTNGEVTNEIVHLRPRVSLAIDSSAPSIFEYTESITGIDQRWVRSARPKHRLDGLQFSMGIILANSLFFDLLWPALYDRIFAFQCSAESIKEILNKQSTLLKSLKVQRRILPRRNAMRYIMIDYRFTKSTGRFVIRDYEWRQLNNFFRHEHQEMEQLHLIIGAEFWDKALTHDYEKILAQPDLSVGREINILQHIAEMAGRKWRSDAIGSGVDGVQLYLTIEGTSKEDGRLHTVTELWMAMTDMMAKRPLQGAGRYSLTKY